MQSLTDNFLIELFKCCLSNQKVLEIIVPHLELQFLPTDNYKKLWKSISDTFQLSNKIVSIGILNERFKDDQEVLNLLLSIKKCKIIDNDIILETFENFIREISFIELHQESTKLWNDKQQDKAIKNLALKSEKINSFSLKQQSYSKVFYNFNQRQELRKNKEHLESLKVPFGIHALDYDTRGGGDIGRSALILGRSGSGKSTKQRWIAVNAARLGLRIVHFQIEGTEDECLDAYDACWSGINLEDIEFGNIPKDKILKIKNVNKDIVDKGGEIHVIAPESFDSLTIEDCNETIEEIEKLYGKVHLALFDNLELFNVKSKFGNTESGERRRREAVANKITNIAINKKLLSIATTQANDIRPEKFNNPDFVLTRSDISEFKNLITPFSYFFTLNCTQDEYEAGIMRIYIDKLRKYKSGQIRKICTSLENSRFYNSKKTLDMFWDIQNNKPK